MAEVEARERFRERIAATLEAHGGSVSLGQLRGQLIREGYSRDMIPVALRGAGVAVDPHGRASLEKGPRQTRL